MGMFIPIIAAVITAVAANDNARYQSNTAADRQKEAIAAQSAAQDKEIASRKQAAPVDAKLSDMPSQNAGAVTQAKQQSIAAQIARRGRASTILTGQEQQNETLGG